ncbi:hypothetical protein UCRPC4_g03403 [Phaeomoniella chlamydospora]|uniref:Uncharacterized protein n=1 Tax=Phaeomoniella chlamydospora TaxID=158046 RepID=A0A0G2EGJ9_PHACM|nr:hypothetical protein UCRPC4_g03403 [Phaeomoniella chlamydospora]
MSAVANPVFFLRTPAARATTAIIGTVVGGVALALHNEMGRLQSNYDKAERRRMAISSELDKWSAMEELEKQKARADFAAA